MSGCFFLKHGVDTWSNVSQTFPCLQNNLFCVEWDVKLCSLIHWLLQQFSRKYQHVIFT